MVLREEGWYPAFVPYVKASWGYAYVRDAQFVHNHFGVVRVDGRLGRFRVSPEVWAAMDEDVQVASVEGAVRFVGAEPRKRAKDGTLLDFQLRATYQRFGSEGFRVISVEGLFPARFDLARVGPSLTGSFVQMELGWALQSYRIEGAKMLKTLSDGGVDLMLLGHIHGYDSMTQAGIPTVIVGADKRFLLVDVAPRKQEIRTGLLWL